MRKQLLALALLTGFSHAASAAVLPDCETVGNGNLILNCSFENIGNTTGGFPSGTSTGWLFDANSSGEQLPEWTDASNSTAGQFYAEVRDNANGTGSAAAGSKFLELDTPQVNTNPYNGAITQSVNLLADTEYAFSFNWAKRVGHFGEDDAFSVVVGIGNTPLFSQSFNTSGLTDDNGDHNWQDFSNSFTTGANGAGNYDFTFIGGGTADGLGTSIDNVSLRAVAAIPEPETYAMLLMGLGLLSFAKRKQKS